MAAARPQLPPAVADVPRPSLQPPRRPSWSIVVAAAAACGALLATGGVLLWISRRRRRRRRQKATQPDESSTATADTAAAAAVPSPSPDLLLTPSLSSPLPLQPALQLETRADGSRRLRCTRLVRTGELLLDEAAFAVPLPPQQQALQSHEAQWEVCAALARLVHEAHPDLLHQLSSIELHALSSSLPPPLLHSPLPTLSDDEWQRTLFGLARATFVREAAPASPGAQPELTLDELSNEAASAPRLELCFLPLASLLPHACWPNAASTGDGRVFACVDLPAGSEPTLCLLQPEQALWLATAARRELLRTERGIDSCRCVRCSGATADLRELEHALGHSALSATDEDALLQRALTLASQSPAELESDEARDFAQLLDSSYDALPAPHRVRFAFRRALLLSPPSWLSSESYARALMEHWCVLQMLLPPAHPLKAAEASLLHDVACTRMLARDVVELLRRVDDAFDADSALRRMPHERVQAIMQQQFCLDPPNVCSVPDCASSTDGDLSSLVCSRCQMTLVACSPDCHYALLQYHVPLCSLFALTNG